MNPYSKTSIIKATPVWKHSVNFVLMLALMILIMKPVMADTVNINKANIETLQKNLQGVGPVKAQAIVDYRKKNGPFKSVNDLKNVPGFGNEIISKNRKNMSTSRGLTRAEENKERKNIKKDGKSRSSDRDNDDDKKNKKHKKNKSDKHDDDDVKGKKDKKPKKEKKNKKSKKDKKSKKEKKEKKSKKDKQNKKSK